jgi:pimeloyl-ACP methyl ester carboxylesterase
VLSDQRRYDVPATIIACEFTSEQLREWMAQGEPSLAELATMHDVDYVDLPTGHWPQFTRPRDLAQAILAAVSRT